MNKYQTIVIQNQLYRVQRVLPNGQIILSPYDAAGPIQNPQFRIGDVGITHTFILPWSNAQATNHCQFKVNKM